MSTQTYRRWSRGIATGLGLLLLSELTLGLYGCASDSEAVTTSTSAAPAALLLSPADLVRVQAANGSGAIQLTGTLQPYNQAAVNARVQAEVAEVLVREGEGVKRGQVLVRQDTTDVVARLRQAEAQLVQAKVEARLAELQARKNEELFKKHYLSEIDFAAITGQAEAKQAQVRVAEAQLAMARKAQHDAVLTAPISGVVAERLAQPGQAVAPTTRLLTLVDLSEMELAATVPARDVARVKVGEPVSFHIEGYGERSFQGRVHRINPVTAPGSRSLTVYVRLPNPGQALRGGMFAKGQLGAGSTGAQLTIPAAAVRQQDGKAVVYLIRDGVLAQQAVTVGASDGEGRVVVQAGLVAGDQLVLTELANRKPGMPVQISER